MKKVLLYFLALSFVVAESAIAQDGNYQLNYYSKRNNSAGADQFFRIINDGTLGSPMSPNHGYICADIYVFDARQEMIECCSCPISANGMLELSLLHDVSNNPLTGFPAPDSGVIKVLGDLGSNCNAQSPVLTTGLLSWGTHIQDPLSGTFITTETVGENGTVSNAELGFLGVACTFVQYLGSGKGVCGCGTGGKFAT